MSVQPNSEPQSDLAAQQAELQAVLSSRLFQRSPSLAQFLRFVCERYFSGEHDRIREHDIALQALGRPDTFDQKKDSIVRVEVHRLRKRLQQYYENEGAGNTLQITIPYGGYSPQFITVQAPEPSVPPAAEPLPAPPPQPAPKRRFSWPVLAALLAGLAVLSVLVIRWFGAGLSS